MDAVRRIAGNTLSLGFSEAIAKLGHFLVFVYIARLLGTLLFGTFSFAYSFALIAVIFADIGINYMLIREMSKDGQNAGKYIFNSFIVKLLFSAIVFAFIFLIMSLWDVSETKRIAVYLVSLYMFLRSFTELLYSVFRAYEKMHYEALSKFISILAVVGAVFLAVSNGLGIIAVSLIYSIVQFLTLISTLIIVIIKFTKIPLEFDLGLSKSIVKKALPFTFSLIFFGIYFYIDSVMLSAIKGDESVGFYSAAYNLVLAVLIVPSMYTNALYPILSRKFAGDKKNLEFIYERSFKYLLLAGLPATVGLFLISNKVIGFIYGNAYSNSIIALKLLSWLLFIKFISYLTGIILSSSDRQHLRATSQGSAAFVNLAANFALIPVYGIIGAAVATLLSEIVLFAMSFYFVSTRLFRLEYKGFLYKPILASVVMYFALTIADMPIFFSIIAGLLSYSAAALALKSLDKQDMKFIKRLLPVGR